MDGDNADSSAQGYQGNGLDCPEPGFAGYVRGAKSRFVPNVLNPHSGASLERFAAGRTIAICDGGEVIEEGVLEVELGGDQKAFVLGYI